MNTIDQWIQETDRLITANDFETALTALETFARQHAPQLVAAVQMRRGDLSSLTEQELMLGESTQVREGKGQLRLQLLKLRQALAAQANTQKVTAPAPGKVHTFASPRGAGPVNLLFVHAPENQAAVEEQKKAIILLRRLGKADFFDIHRDLAAGNRTAGLQDAIRRAEIILLFLSNDFLASDECFQIQQDALGRSRKNRAAVIPIQLNPCDWSMLAIAGLVSLPRNGRFISEWENPDAAFSEVGRELSGLVEQVRSRLDYSADTGAPETASPEIDLTSLRQEIGQGKIESVLTKLLVQTIHFPAYHDEVLHLQSRWNRLQDELHRNLISRTDANVNSSHITEALLELLRNLEAGR